MAGGHWDWITHIAGVAAGFALLAAMLPPTVMGSGYYIFLRWVVFGVSLGWIAYGIKFPRNTSLIIGICAGVLWNPVVPIYMDRGIWFWLNGLFGILFLIFSNGVVPTIEEGLEDKRSNWK